MLLYIVNLDQLEIIYAMKLHVAYRIHTDTVKRNSRTFSIYFYFQELQSDITQ